MTTTRDDVPRDPLPPPPPPTLPAPREPTPDFLRQFSAAVRGGASPANAAEWAGVPRWTLKKWLKRKGALYDTLRATQRSALAHLKVRLQAEIAKKHPERALRSLHVREQQGDDGRRYSKAPRPYSVTGRTVVARALPYLVERVADAAIPDTDITPVEVAARELRSQMIADHGGAAQITAAKRALIDSVIGSWLITQSLDAACMRMAAEDGIISRKHRRAFPLVLDRMKAASVLSTQLAQLGLDRAAPPVQSLSEYLAARSTSEPAPDDGEVNGTSGLA